METLMVQANSGIYRVEDSYLDHSLFLVNKERYSSLFELKKNDYRNWARGLKKAGYATNPDYANKLIQLIETYNLSYYDNKESDFVLIDEIYHPEYSAFDNNAGVEVNLEADKIAVSTIREMLVAGTGKTAIRNQVLSRRNR